MNTEASSTDPHDIRPTGRVTGLFYLIGLSTAVYANFFVRYSVYEPNDPTTTAKNLIEFETVVRFGLAVELVGILALVGLTASLYALLKPFGERMGRAAVLWWIGEITLLAVAICLYFPIFFLLSGAEYSLVFEPSERDAIVLLLINLFYDVYNIALTFFTLGMIVFAILFYRSRYVPRLLSIFGVVAALSMFTDILLTLVDHPASDLFGLAPSAMVALYELIMGAWLLVFSVSIRAKQM
ncbi:MAG: DUF4386 domain-containing protein [Pseudomonadota bacterium]